MGFQFTSHFLQHLGSPRQPRHGVGGAEPNVHVDCSTAASGVHSEEWDAGPRDVIATLSNGNGELEAQHHCPPDVCAPRPTAMVGLSWICFLITSHSSNRDRAGHGMGRRDDLCFTLHQDVGMGDQRFVVSDQFCHGVAPAPLLPGQGPTDHGATTGDDRLFPQAVFWRVGTGFPLIPGQRRDPESLQFNTLCLKAPQIQDLMTSTTNPLLLGQGLPPYGRFTPDAIGAGMPELLRQLEGALAHHEARLVTLDDPTWEQVMDPLHHIEERLRWAWGVVNHLMGVCDSDALRQVHRQQQPAVVRFYNRLGQSGPLYKALRQLQQRRQEGLLPLDGVQQRILTAAVQAMELQGVGLEPERRQAFNAASTRLAELSTRYSNHVLDATKAWSLLLNDPQQVDGLPGSLRELMAAAAREAGHRGATAAAGPWQLGLDLPRYGPFLRYSRQQHLREQAYRAYVGRASAGDTDNHPLIHEILTLRHQQAQRLGYNTWAQVSLVSKMAGSVEEIQRLVEELRRASRPAAAVELEQLGRLAKEMGAPQGERLKPWDVSYWSEQLRRRRFDLDSEALRPWFPLEQVLEGLFGLCERLFDIRILAADGEAPTWHRDVRFFQVVDQEQNTPIAALYLDPYARPGQKRGGAWMDECLVRQWDQDGRLVHPVAYLICNQTPPVNGTPSLMTFMEVQTLFHEFGHGLQHMLTTINRPQAAGLNLVEDDAIELASQFMENWCYDQPTIMAIARHWQTGAPLPEAEFQKIRAARTFMAGTAMLRQLSFAQGDLELHDRWRPGSREAPEATWRRIATAMAVLPPIAEDATICSFEHLFAGGYDAGYYAYKWSEVLSADAFSAFEAVGLENEAAIRTLGKRYRDTVLSLGGSQHAGEVFRAFRGREPSTEALLRHAGLVGEAV